MPEHQQTQKSTESKTTSQKQATPRIQAPSSHPMAIIQRARINPKSLTPADILQLQRTIGNRAVGRLISEIRSSSTAQKAPVQRQEIPEEEEPLQGKMVETIQSQEIPEEEESLQGKFESKPEIACPSCFAAPIVQRQEIPEEEEPLQGKMIETVQRQEIPEEEEPLQTKRENDTGMPDNLKAGVESLSGIDMSDVRVHYNSDKPAEVGALAYTQGTDIHVAPGQERHLPHEAWHVVQQIQGRVNPTIQLKGGIPVNDDEGLEYEADMMGERAAVVGYNAVPSQIFQGRAERSQAHHQREPIIGQGEKGSLNILSSGDEHVNREIRRPVLQPRMPSLAREQILAQPEVARELLWHLLRTMPIEEYAELVLKNPYLPELEAGEQSPDALVKIYNDIYNAWLTTTTASTKFTEESASAHEPTQQESSQIIAQLTAVKAGLLQTINNDQAIHNVFGLKLDELQPAKNVLQLALEFIGYHYTHQTCPVLVAGNRDHNQWVGVGGMTSYGNEQVRLGQTAVTKLAAGDPAGQAFLVHEFTHAAANTEDVAYGLMAMSKLGPRERVKNASHYEHCYLETVAGHNPERYYSADVSTGRAKEGDQKGLGPEEKQQANIRVAMRKKKVAGAKSLLDKMWNTLDNCYLAAQRLANEPHRSDLEIKSDILSTSLGTWRNGPGKKSPDYRIDLALIEDRTNYLRELNDMRTLRFRIKNVDDKQLLTLEPDAFIASIIEKELKFPEGQASLWVYYLLNPTELKLPLSWFNH